MCHMAIKPNQRLFASLNDLRKKRLNNRKPMSKYKNKTRWTRTKRRKMVRLMKENKSVNTHPIKKS